MTQNIFDEDGILIMFFTYVVLITGHTVWGFIKHYSATSMTMYALFFVTAIEFLMLGELSGWTFIRKVTNKEEQK